MKTSSLSRMDIVFDVYKIEDLLGKHKAGWLLGGGQVSNAGCKELEFHIINIHNIHSFREIHQENYEALYMNYHISLS